MKKALRQTQTLRAGCSTAEPENFRPAADPLPGGAGRQKIKQLEMVTTFSYRPSLVKNDARIFALSWKQTHKHKPTNPQTGPITIHCTAKPSAQCNN